MQRMFWAHLLVCSKLITLFPAPCQFWLPFPLFRGSDPIFPVVRAHVVAAGPTHQGCVEFVTKDLEYILPESFFCEKFCRCRDELVFRARLARSVREVRRTRGENAPVNATAKMFEEPREDVRRYAAYRRRREDVKREFFGWGGHRGCGQNLFAEVLVLYVCGRSLVLIAYLSGSLAKIKLTFNKSVRMTSFIEGKACGFGGKPGQLSGPCHQLFLAPNVRHPLSMLVLGPGMFVDCCKRIQYVCHPYAHIIVRHFITYEDAGSMEPLLARTQSLRRPNFLVPRSPLYSTSVDAIGHDAIMLRCCASILTYAAVTCLSSVGLALCAYPWLGQLVVGQAAPEVLDAP